MLVREVRKPVILVVDDAPENIDILKNALISDYTVKLATNGRKALEAARKQPCPDLILLDIMMVGMDGYEVCRILKADPETRQIPVIFVTAKTDLEDELNGLALGAVDYITKPFSIPIVHARVKTHLELKHQRDKLLQQTNDLSEREASQRSVLENALDAIVTVDAHGRVVEFNPAAERLFGFIREEIMGMEIAECIIPPEFRERHRAALARLPEVLDEHLEISRRIETVGLRADGTIIELQLSLVAVSLAGKRHFTAFIQDISERKNLIKSLNAALVAAEASSKAKSEFLAAMSHEIRTPMNVVLGMSDVLLETDLDPDQLRIVQTMSRSGKALLGVINDVLDFSRIEAGRFALSESPFSPRRVIEETARLMRMAAEERGLSLSEEVASGVPDAVMGDEGRVRQVLINLLGNAIKFTHRGQIAVRLACHPRDAGILLFCVADTGIGIDQEHVGHIFEDFTQADSSIVHRYGGTGLGLAISRKLVELMGGRIWVESQLGQGSTFHFTLPSHPVEMLALPAMPMEQDVGVAIRSLRILLAEDSPDNQLLFQIYLRKTPHCLVIVNDGVEAVARVQEESFDLLLTDIEMPNMDGYAATRAIRQWEKEKGRHPLTIMALSAHAGIEKRRESLAVGCNEHLTKPIKKKDLLDAVQRLAESLGKMEMLNAMQYVPERVVS
ncbi:MAG: response regulator [Magnetococcus sp. MYC-9]